MLHKSWCSAMPGVKDWQRRESTADNTGITVDEIQYAKTNYPQAREGLFFNSNPGEI